MPKVIVVGSANTDLTVRAVRLPRSGETVVGEEFMTSYGGKGANQALAALRAGAEVTLLAKIGTDPYGNHLYDHLVESGLAPEGLLRDQMEPAGMALIAVDEEGNNQIIVVPGSNGRFAVEDFRTLEPLLQERSLLLTQLEIPLPTVEYVLHLAKTKGMITVLDPAPASPLPLSLYPLVDIITPNETEAGNLTGTVVETDDEAETATSILLSRGCGIVLLTMGARGVLMGRIEGVERFSALPVPSVDSVAAGDAFNGALAAALTAGRSTREAIRFASAAGALSTTKRGAQESLPTEKEIQNFMQKEGKKTEGH
jgi:ribokinase